MLLNDRLSSLQSTVKSHVCTFCFSRRYSIRTPVSCPPRRNSYISFSHREHRVSSINLNYSSSGGLVRKLHDATSVASVSATGSSLPPLPITPFDKPGDVRDYLKKWSKGHQDQIRNNAPTQVSLERNAVLPNSLFIRSNVENDAGKEEDLETDVNGSDANGSSDFADDAEDVAHFSIRRMEPGDIFRIASSSGRLRQQLAVYIGSRGVQSLYLLADGRWYADCQSIYKGGLARNVVKAEELFRLEPYLPQQTIEYQKGEDGAIVPFTAFGEIPHTESFPILTKLRALNEEMEEAKRNYSHVVEEIYQKAAHATQWRFEFFDDLLRDCSNIDFDTLSEGAKLYLTDASFVDERMIPAHQQGTHTLGLMPTQSLESLRTVTGWARSYQDAAARAATGQSVTEELRTNPLTGFISKARRIIAKSRKIRLPMSDGQLGTTLESAQPRPGKLDRKPSGEEFTEQEKAIIEYLWLAFVRKPSPANVGNKRTTAIASLIIRAVGAYPKFVLNSATGTLFLKELGCLDPWAMLSDHFVHTPNPMARLHHGAASAKREAETAADSLGLREGQEDNPLPDTMAHLRKDWGDLEVFCIDDAKTRVIDDGISIEPAQDSAGHYWIHVHIAHPSAFIPHDHPLLAQGPVMGTSFYHAFGAIAYIPYKMLQACSLRNHRPVLTISTLLSESGTVKDIKVRPGIVRNVIQLDYKAVSMSEAQRATKPISGRFSVGARQGRIHKFRDEEDAEKARSLSEQYVPKFELIHRLLLARWNARNREHPECLKMLKFPNARVSLHVSPMNDMREYSRDRIYRSEHVVGDPCIRVSCDVYDFERTTYNEQEIHQNFVASAMMLAAESAAAWTWKHKIPVLYRFMSPERDFSVDTLNKLGPHDFFIAPTGGESLEMTRHLTLNVAGYMHVTSPLRRFRDLVNHHQIDAFLKAQASQQGISNPVVHYPRSREELLSLSKRTSDGNSLALTGKNQRTYWVLVALFRAFYFGEAKLPEVWDIMIDNPVVLGGSQQTPVQVTKGKISLLGLDATLAKSEQGWEDMAKMRQFVPCKIIKIEPDRGVIVFQAVGPPSDEPSVKDLAYPELQNE